MFKSEYLSLMRSLWRPFAIMFHHQGMSDLLNYRKGSPELKTRWTQRNTLCPDFAHIYFLKRYTENIFCYFFQAHGENAPPCLTIWHFTELMADKGQY